MDKKEIVEKALKGEDYSTLVKSLPVEKQPEAFAAIADAFDAKARTTKGQVDEETQKLIGVRKGIKDIQDKGATPPADVLETFKKEQVTKAKNKFYADARFSSLTSEQKSQMDAEIEKRGIQSTDADFVFDELKKVYGSLFADVMLNEIEKAKRGSAGAANRIINSAGGQNTGPTGDPDKFSQGVRDLWEAVVKSGHKGFTLDQAKEQFEKGRGFKQRALTS